LLLVFTALPAIAEESEDYPSVTGPCNLEFPKDHGAHPDYRTEWWYYTGNLQTESGDRYGFQLTFFRSRINPPGDDQKWPNPPSAWRTSQVFMAHAAISDIVGKQHLHDEDVARGAIGIAGVTQTDMATEVFLKDWSTRIEENQHILTAAADDFSFEFKFLPAIAPVSHGDHGYSIKGSTSERASCYYSFTRLEGKGRITIGSRSVTVTGSAWMDHEFSTAVLEPGITGWDWFSIQLCDRTEIMIYLLRKDRGGFHPASSGTFIDIDGQTRHLIDSDFKVAVLDTWESRQSGARYPARWRIQVFPFSLDLIIMSNLADQEMRTTDSTGVTYWEGSVSIEGSKDGRAIDGAGYVELTGYAGPFNAPM
jgi:predicted secreted hydrolase